MRYIVYYIIFGVYTMSYCQNIGEHQWKNRVLLICTDSFSTVKFQKQKSEFEKYPNELKDRKLVVYQITDKNYRIGLNGIKLFETDKEIFKKYIKGAPHFRVILIGLDSSIKMSAKSFITAHNIFDRIDRHFQKIATLISICLFFE